MAFNGSCVQHSLVGGFSWFHIGAFTPKSRDKQGVRLMWSVRLWDRSVGELAQGKSVGINFVEGRNLTNVVHHARSSSLSTRPALASPYRRKLRTPLRANHLTRSGPASCTSWKFVSTKSRREQVPGRPATTKPSNNDPRASAPLLLHCTHRC
jgi:hypothetical protein